MTKNGQTDKLADKRNEGGEAGVKCAGDGVRGIFSVGSHVRFWLMMAVGLGVDLWSKHWAVQTLGDPVESQLRGPMVLIREYLVFRTVFNRGAVAGMAEGQTILLIGASVAALGVVLWLFFISRSDQWFYQLGLGMLLAGALGNMYDRIFNDGQVVDFIEVNLHFWPANPWPTFNVADVLLCVGVGVVLVSTIVGGRKRRT